MNQSNQSKSHLLKEKFMSMGDWIMDHTKIVMPVVLVVCVIITVFFAVNANRKEALEKEKCRVIMTRESDIGLYQESDTNKKTADLKKRVEMMNQEEVDLIISVHQNSFSGESSRGAQVFYHSGSESGETFAKLLQAQLISSLDTSNHREAKGNTDYYLLKNTEKTAVIVECGFLSNQEEARKLCDEAYQRQVAWAIAQGTMQYIDTLSVETR